MSAIENAAREELDSILAELRGVYSNTTDHLRVRGEALAVTAQELGDALLLKRITFEEFKGRLEQIADAVKSEALAAGYESQAVFSTALARAATSVLRIAALALA